MKKRVVKLLEAVEELCEAAHRGSTYIDQSDRIRALEKLAKRVREGKQTKPNVDPRAKAHDQ